MVRAGLVRRVLVCLCVCLCICTGTAAAATHTVYTQGNISTSVLTYFRDIVSGVGINDNYVFYRSGRYEYKLVVGDLKCENNIFSGLDPAAYMQVYTLNTDTSSYESYRYTISMETNFNLNAQNYLVYSDLGHYPKLEERGLYYAFCTLFVVCIIGLCALVRPLFAFVLRIRNG